MSDLNEKTPEIAPVDKARRRLTKAGLAAPAVLGALASRQVLGNEIHHCTPSGHISGFASVPNTTVQCSSLGETTAYYAADKTRWPGGNGGDFLLSNGDPRPFGGSPNSLTPKFTAAYEVRRIDNNDPVRDATVWDVLKGVPVNNSTGDVESANKLVVKSGHSDTASFDLGKEALAACMNAIAKPNFPISAQAVVAMFNSVIVTGGLDQVTSTAQWNATEVIEYFRSLHA